ncbi:MAG: ParB/RepB/Spo0J family partition protein [Phormidesmis sp. RL_2_1]|nr:ParB/RepB/Spo0J family partition protein [Phormidesmis sp. RL_2_1]
MCRSTQATQPRDSIPQLKEELEGLKSQAEASLEKPIERPIEIPIERITPLQLPDNMKQPRLYFDPHKIELLKESIQKHGVLEPILLRTGQNGNFEIISGERRWRCCRALKMASIPGIVRQMSDATALEAALIAHLLSEEISLIEQTESILSLLSLRLNLSFEIIKTSLYQVNNSQIRGTHRSGHFTDQQLRVVHEILAEFGIKLSSFVSNRLPLLNLSPAILDSVKEGRLSPTNAVLVNRQPAVFHQSLISQAEGKTKGDVVSLIKATVTPAKRTSDQQKTDQPQLEQDSANFSHTLEYNPKQLYQQICERIQSVENRAIRFDNPEVIRRLTKIDSLLREIESFNNSN